MIQNIYAFKDKVAGYAIDVKVSNIDSKMASTVFKRQLIMQPAPVFRDVEVYLIGAIDDESLVIKPCEKQFICNFDDVFEKLDLIAEKNKILADAKKEAEEITKKAQEGVSQNA